MKKKILILGSSGFLGNNLVPLLRSNEKYDVIVSGGRDNVNFLYSYDTFHFLEKVFPDIIINLAADVGSVEYVAKNPASIVQNNMRMYLNIYESISQIRNDVKIINTLANCSYPGDADIQNEEDWWKGPVHPSVMSFGNAKRFLWVLGECYRKQYGIDSLSLIMPNAYGILDHTDINRVHAMNGIIIRMIQAKRNNDKIFSIWGSGNPIREWVYMPDVARIIVQCLDRKFDETYFNIGQQKGISIRETSEIIKKALNYDGELVYDTSKPDGAPVKILGNKLFKEYFPDFQFTTYEKGIEKTISYYETEL